MKYEFGGPCGDRTHDLRIKRQCLDQLWQSRFQFKTSVKLQSKRRLMARFVVDATIVLGFSFWSAIIIKNLEFNHAEPSDTKTFPCNIEMASRYQASRWADGEVFTPLPDWPDPLKRFQLKNQILDELKGGRNARKRSQFPGAQRNSFSTELVIVCFYDAKPTML